MKPVSGKRAKVGWRHSAEAIAKMRAAAAGRVLSDEHRANIKKASA
jgi:hypothetical protein